MVDPHGWAEGLIDALDSQVCLLDGTGCIVHVNRSWEEFARDGGYSPAGGFHGLNYLSVCDAAGDTAPEAAEAAAGIRAVLRGEVRRFSLEYPCHTPAAQRWFEVAVTCMRRSGAAFAVVVHSDITGRRSAQEALEASERRFRSLVENVPGVAVQGYDEARRVVLWNAASERLYGYSREEALGRRVEELIVPEEARAEFAGAMDAWVGHGVGPSAGEQVLKRKDGTPVTVFSSRVVLAGRGGEKELHCVDVDLTERKRAERCLTESEGRFRSLAEATTSGIYVLRGTRFVWVNAAFQRITGYAEAELLGMEAADLVHPHQRGEVLEHVLTREGAQAPGGRLEVRLVTKGGGERWIVLDSWRLTVDGEPASAGMAFDITDRKVAEEAVRKERAILWQAERIGQVGAAEWDLVSDRWTFSEGWLSIHGFAGSPSSLSTPIERTHPDDVPLVRRALQAALEGSAPYEVEHRVVQACDGSVREVQARGEVTRDPEGRPLTLTCVARDVTEARRAGREARRRESELAAARRLAEVGSWEADLGTGAVTWSEEVYRIFGLGLGSAPPPLEQQAALYAPGSRTLFESTLLAGLTEELPAEVELEALRPDGTTRWVTVIGEPRRDNEGRLDGLRGTVIDLTERKLTEALRRSEENFRGLFDSIDHMLFVVDDAGRLLKVNPAVRARLDLEDGDLVGRSVLVLHPESFHGEASRVLSEMLAGREQACQIPVVTRNGTLLPVETRVVRGVWDGRSVLFGIAKDLSALKASEEKFAKAFQLNPSPMALSAWPSRHYLDVNEAFLRTLGYTREELVGKGPQELGLFARPEQGQEFGRLIAEQTVVEGFEVEVLARDGTVRHGLLSADVLTLQDDRLLVTVMVDTTERRRAEREVEGYRLHLEDLVRERTAALAEANTVLEREMSDRRLAQETLATREAHYRLLFEASPLPMWLVDLESLSFLQVNAAALLHYGYSREEFLGMTMGDLRLPEDLPGPGLDVRRSGAGKPDAGTYRHRNRDGSVTDVEVTTDEIEVGGRRAGLVLAKDVTEQRRVDAEIRRLNLELEERVRQRTIQLEAANGELEAFSYSVSHDLRAPLRAMSGYAELLREHLESARDAEGCQLLDGIRTGSRRMEKLIHGFLALSRASREGLKVVPVDMSRLAREVVASLLRPEPGRRIEVAVAELPPAVGDPGLLRQVYQNLVSNALKFSAPRDASFIEIGGRSCPSGNEYFVRDNGVGFDPEQASRLFGTFQRLHSEREFEGTGIGLSLVRRIVERHGGRVWATGHASEGATFWFTIRPGDPAPGPAD